jgi:hypothetical protein
MDRREPRHLEHDASSGSAAERDPDRPRFVFVVARTRPELVLTLRRQFQDDQRVDVLLDRRQHDRRAKPAPIGVPERRRQADRRRPQDYWEDPAHHSAVLIPVSLHPVGHVLDVPPVGHVREPDKELTMERMPVDETRVLAWVQESQHVFQQVLPTLLEQRAALTGQLHDTTQRCRDLQAENDALRAEVARATAANRQLAQGQADAVDSVSQFLARLTEVLEPMRALAEKLGRVRPPAAV